MLEIKQIDDLQKILEKLKSRMTDLEEEISRLTKALASGEFLPDSLAETIREKLEGIERDKKDFVDRFSTLDAGTVPLKITDAEEVLEQYRQRKEKLGPYIEAIRFFLSLYSDDDSVQGVIEKRKAALRRLELERMDEPALEREAGSYVWLHDAFYETDPVKKFSLIYKMSSVLDEPIVMGVQFGTLKIRETAGLDDGAGKPSEAARETPAAEETPGAEELSAEEKWSTGEKLPDPQEAAWISLGIDRPEELTVKEEENRLEVRLSPKASVKFGFKEFKREIIKQEDGKQEFGQKIQCLREAFEGGYTREAFSIREGKSGSYYDSATEQLWKAGYLKKCMVKGYEAFYVLSRRGENAFLSRDSLAYLNATFKEKRQGKRKEVFEDTANSVIARILFDFVNVFARSLRPDYRSKGQEVRMEEDCFSVALPDLIPDKKTVFLGIVSERVEQFQKFHEMLKEAEANEADLLVILGASRGKARAAAGWAAFVTEGRIPVWYCGYPDEEMFDQKTDEEVEPETGTRPETGEGSREEEAAENPEEIRELRVEETPGPLAEEVSDSPVERLPETSPETIREEGQREAAVTLEDGTKREEQEQNFQRMLADGKFYAASAYVKILSREDSSYEPVYRQMAYALNDPMGGCGYSSERIFEVFYSGENRLPGHYAAAAALRNYFLDQTSYDHSLQQLQTMLTGNPVLQEETGLNQIAYMLLTFKTDYHRGIDRYADYRERARADLERRLEELKREARNYCENYSENAAHKQVVETGKLLCGPGSDLSEYLKIVIDDDREMVEFLKENLSEHYVKDQAEISRENLDPAKIDRILDENWSLAGQRMKVGKKSTKLLGKYRINLFNRVDKIVRALCDYVFLIQSALIRDDDPALQEYKRIRTPLLKEMKAERESLSKRQEEELSVRAGKAVLIETLRELEARLEGTYQESEHRYYYVNFLRNDSLLLDEEFLPVLENVPELPELSAKKRILEHDRLEKKDWAARLNEIAEGGEHGDDYGSAELIFRYLADRGLTLEEVNLPSDSLEEAALAAQRGAQEGYRKFIEDIELAQSYGKIDYTSENSKEMMLQVVDNWFSWAQETKNYGFFKKIPEGFRKKIEEDARFQGGELRESLDTYLKRNPGLEEDEVIGDFISEIRNRIEQQNYAAAEDLFNRLLTNDLDRSRDRQGPDPLLEFLDEYELNYRTTEKPGTTLRSLVGGARINKDTKGADRLLDHWPKRADVGEVPIRSLLTCLGFNPEVVEKDLSGPGKIESYFVRLKRPQNGRRNHYTHPIAIFGSEAEEKGFRVVCLFGKTNASRLIDTFGEIGNARDTLVLLDYALTLADRRTLARKTKTDLNGKTFAVIDRVVLVYLAKHYAETAVNRILMSLVMPFASYQPYINKSADMMPQEIFIGRKQELEKIESPTGVNLVYGGRQLGKTALLRMAKKDIDRNENGDRAVIVNVLDKDYKETARALSAALYDEGILKKEHITEDWDELARDIKNRLRDETDKIPYFLLMIDEADAFIESCEATGYQPFNALKEIQSLGTGRFKFVAAGLRNIIRFKKSTENDNCPIPHLASMAVKPFKALEARELLEVPLSYLGFRFPEDNETEVLVSTIFGATNYFPGLIQLYCTKLIESLKRDYAGYSESETPPYYVRERHVKKALADQTLQEDIRQKFDITLRVGKDDYYYIIALLVAYHYHENKSQSGCSAAQLLRTAESFSIRKLSLLGKEKLSALMEEMQELNVLQHAGDGRYRFTRHSFCQMMGTAQQIDDELMSYMED